MRPTICLWGYGRRYFDRIDQLVDHRSLTAEIPVQLLGCGRQFYEKETLRKTTAGRNNLP